MSAVQDHGFVFERWVKDHFSKDYRGGYSDAWDIVGSENCLLPPWRGLPISIKTRRNGAAIDLGDALRQRAVDEVFLMIVGFWEQRNETEKFICDIGLACFSPETWDRLWGPISAIHVQTLAEIVTNRQLHYTAARQGARTYNASLNADEVRLRPKIDSKGQRRVQCSLSYHAFWNIARETLQPQSGPTLFGQRFQNPILSPARTFNR